MPAGDKFNVLPSRATKVAIKQKLLTAKNGHHLLKRKRDALEVKLREINAEIEARRGSLDDMMRTAYLALAKAKFLGFDRVIISISPSEHADVLLRIKYWNVVGVKLPHFEVVQLACDSFPLAGLARGGQQVLNVRRDFFEILLYLAEVASLQYAAKVLKKSVHDNNMRVNGLEYVLIPKFENTIRFIDEELDELEREEFHRMKMSKTKKKLLKEKHELEEKRLMAAEEAEK